MEGRGGGFGPTVSRCVSDSLGKRKIQANDVLETEFTDWTLQRKHTDRPNRFGLIFVGNRFILQTSSVHFCIFQLFCTHQNHRLVLKRFGLSMLEIVSGFFFAHIAYAQGSCSSVLVVQNSFFAPFVSVKKTDAGVCLVSKRIQRTVLSHSNAQERVIHANMISFCSSAFSRARQIQVSQ